MARKVVVGGADGVGYARVVGVVVNLGYGAELRRTRKRPVNFRIADNPL
jgi:hypothetical protein